MTLEQAKKNIGRDVEYKGPPRELGWIAKVTNDYVFVLYDGDRTTKATRACDLHLYQTDDDLCERLDALENI